MIKIATYTTCATCIRICKYKDKDSTKDGTTWLTFRSGQGLGISNLCLTQSLTTDFQNLCKLDVLDLADDNDEITEPVYRRF